MLSCSSEVTLKFNLIGFLSPYSRISKTAWIKREEDDAIENIYKRVGAVTGLNMETSEELQVECAKNPKTSKTLTGTQQSGFLGFRSFNHPNPNMI